MPKAILKILKALAKVTVSGASPKRYYSPPLSACEAS